MGRYPARSMISLRSRRRSRPHSRRVSPFRLPFRAPRFLFRTNATRQEPVSADGSQEMDAGTVRPLHDLDALREGVFHLLEVRDDQYLLEVLFDRLDHFDELFPALAVLRAESLVHYQRLQTRAG